VYICRAKIGRRYTQFFHVAFWQKKQRIPEIRKDYFRMIS